MPDNKWTPPSDAVEVKGWTPPSDAVEVSNEQPQPKTQGLRTYGQPQQQPQEIKRPEFGGDLTGVTLGMSQKANELAKKSEVSNKPQRPKLQTKQVSESTQSGLTLPTTVKGGNGIPNEQVQNTDLQQKLAKRTEDRDKAVNDYLDRKGLKQNTAQRRDAEENLTNAIQNDDFVVANSKDGTPKIFRTQSNAETFLNTLKDSATESVDAIKENSATDSDLLNIYKQKDQQLQEEDETKPKNTWGGYLSGLGGGSIKPLAIQSLDLIPYIGQATRIGTATMIADAYNTALAKQRYQLYREGVQNGLSPEDALAKAKQTAQYSALGDAAIAAVLAHGTGEVANAISNNALKTAENGFKKSLLADTKGVLKGAAKVGGYMGASEVAKTGVEAAGGYDRSISQAAEKGLEGVGSGVMMDLAFKGITHAVLNPFGIIKGTVAAAKNLFTEAPKEIQDAYIETLPDDVAKKVKESVDNFSKAKDDIKDFVPEEHLASFAGKLEKAKGLEQKNRDLELSKVGKPQFAQDQIDLQIQDNQKEIDSINKEVNKAAKEGKAPIEKDDVTGLKQGQEPQLEETKPIERKSTAQTMVDNANEIISITGKDNAAEAHSILMDISISKTDEANESAKKIIDEKGISRTSDEANKIYDEEFERLGVNNINRLIEHLNNSESAETIKNTSLSEDAKEWGKKIKPSQSESKSSKKDNFSFKTSKGSEYLVNEDGTTTRNKAARSEHPNDEGIQDKSDKTYYISKDDMDKLSQIQTTTNERKVIAETSDGKIGIKWLTGKDAGKFEKSTLINPSNEPKVGLHPLELWKKDNAHHFGNEITEINNETTKNKIQQPTEVEKPIAETVSKVVKPTEIIKKEDVGVVDGKKLEKLNELSKLKGDEYFNNIDEKTNLEKKLTKKNIDEHLKNGWNDKKYVNFEISKFNDEISRQIDKKSSGAKKPKIVSVEIGNPEKHGSKSKYHKEDNLNWEVKFDDGTTYAMDSQKAMGNPYSAMLQASLNHFHSINESPKYRESVFGRAESFSPSDLYKYNPFEDAKQVEQPKETIPNKETVEGETKNVQDRNETPIKIDDIGEGFVLHRGSKEGSNEGFHSIDKAGAEGYAEDNGKVVSSTIKKDANVLKLVSGDSENYTDNTKAIDEFYKIIGEKERKKGSEWAKGENPSDITTRLWNNKAAKEKLKKAGIDIVIGNTIDGVDAFVVNKDALERVSEKGETKKETKEEKTYANKDLERAKAKEVHAKVRAMDEPTKDPRQIALRYLADGNKVGQDAINEIAGTVKRARLNTGEKELKSAEAKSRDYTAQAKDLKEAADKGINLNSLDDISHYLSEKHGIDSMEMKDALMEAIGEHNTRLEAGQSYLERYNTDYAEEQHYARLAEERAAEFDKELKDINDWLTSEGEKEHPLEAQEEHINNLIKQYEAEFKAENQQSESTSKREVTEKISSGTGGEEVKSEIPKEVKDKIKDVVVKNTELPSKISEEDYKSLSVKGKKEYKIASGEEKIFKKLIECIWD